MVALVLILGCIILFISVVYYRRTVIKEQIIKAGGLLQVYPNFRHYINSLTVFEEIKPDLVSLTPNKAEYKQKIISDGGLVGFYVFSLNHTVKGWLEGKFLNREGKQLALCWREIGNGIDEPFTHEYPIIIDNMLGKLFEIPEVIASIQVIEAEGKNLRDHLQAKRQERDDAL